MILNMSNAKELKDKIQAGSFIALARAITLVENDIPPADDLLKILSFNEDVPVIGITGPPGAGKSTLVNAITEEFSKLNKNVAILAVDPTSPFNYGSLLGDRIRMSSHFNRANVFIRSIATRGSLGGISAKTIEIIDLLKAACFDLIIVETVGVGQSEIEIAGLADKTILVLVPEAGDEIQHIKSGLMEVAQAFVVNKADRPGADVFANKLSKMVKEQHLQVPIFKTVADKFEGVSALCDWIAHGAVQQNSHKPHLLAEKAFKLIQNQRMKSIDRLALLEDLKIEIAKKDFNMYNFVANWVSSNQLNINLG